MSNEIQQRQHSAIARLITLAPQSYIAFGVYTTIELLDNPVFYPVPTTPAYAYGLLQWQNRLIPLIDLEQMLYYQHQTNTMPVYQMPNQTFEQTGIQQKAFKQKAFKQKTLDRPKYALVLAYQKLPSHTIDYCAIVLDTLPQNIVVEDTQTSDLPESLSMWRHATIACFTHQDDIVPILDTNLLFNR